MEHAADLSALNEIGISRTYIEILDEIYTDASASIHLDDDISPEIKIARGVRQGDPISPKLFTCTMESIFQKADLSCRGLRVDGEQISDLRFADDVALLTRSCIYVNASLYLHLC